MSEKRMKISGGSLSHDQMECGLRHGWPGVEFTLYGDELIWPGPSAPPSVADIEAEFDEAVWVEEKKPAARSALIAMTDELSRPILSAYPEAERAGWAAKEAEARAFLAIVERERTASDAPTLEMISQAEKGDESASERMATVTAKVERIVQKSSEWRVLSASIEGFRSKYEALIDAASTEAEIAAIMVDAGTDITEMRSTFGL